MAFEGFSIFPWIIFPKRFKYFITTIVVINYSGILMIHSKKSLEEKIKSIRKQLAALDSKREVLGNLLEKLENQKMVLEESRQGEAPYTSMEGENYKEVWSCPVFVDTLS
jgi:cell division protein FtsB